MRYMYFPVIGLSNERLIVNELKKLYIEPTSDCNLSCEMCFRHTWFDEKYEDMDYEVFEKILVDIPDETEIIFFGGMGEPLHHPRILDMVAATTSRGYRVELLTNASLLTEAMAGSLIKLGLSRLWVSMDNLVATPEDGIGHIGFDDVTSRIKVFNKLRHNKPNDVELGITFVATKDNVHQLAQLPFFYQQI